MEDFKDTKIKLNIMHAIISGMIVLILFIGVSVVCRIAPFGDKTFLMFDLKRQYVDYDSYLKTILKGENNIFYSFSTTLGSGMTGFITYYLLSPFLLILSIFPQSILPIGVSIVICMKLVLASFIMDLFLQRTVLKESLTNIFGEKSPGIFICSVSWAFSGYLFAHSMNMMWIDVVIMLPLLMWALETLLDQNRKTPYIACLAAMLLLNYYITYQVLLFTALWTIMRIIVRKDEHPVKQVLRVFVSTIISPCMGAVLLIPTALELTNSPKDITQLGLTLNGQDLIIRDVLSKLPTFAYDYIEPRYGYPQLFCGVILILFTMLYFLDRKRSLRERIGMMVMFLIFLVSFCKDILNLIWHAGMEPSGHPYRQAFMWVFLMIVCAAHAFNDGSDIINIPRVLTVVFLTAVLFFFVIRKRYDHVSVYTLYINVALLVIYGILLIVLVFRKKLPKPVGALAMAAILFINLGDLAANAAYTYLFQAMNGEKLSDYSSVVERTEDAVRYVKSTDDSFYRTENLNPRQQNDAMQYGYNGVTHYSSAGMTYVRYFLQRLGFNEDDLYTHYGHDNTATMDSLLGIKYVLSDGMYKPHPDYELIYDGEEKVYKNPYFLGVAIGTNGYDLSDIASDYGSTSADSMDEVPDLDPFSLQEEIYGRLIGEEVSIFKSADVKRSDLLNDEDHFYYEYEVDPSIEGELYFYLDGLIKSYESLSIYLDDEFLTTYGNAACTKILNFGYKKPGDKIRIKVYSESRDGNFGIPFFVTEDTGVLKEAYEKICDDSLEITKISSSHIKIKTGDHDGVFLSVPCEKGWNFKLDGKKIVPVAIYDSLTYIPVPNRASAHHIDMVFIPEGAIPGVIISIFGIAVFLYLLFKEMGWSITDKKINFVIKLIITILIIFILICVIRSDIRQRGLCEADFMYASLDGERINIFESDDGYYLFLPSYADESKVKYSKEALKHEIKVMRSENLPTIYITTRSGSLDKVYADKEYKESGKIRVFDKNGSVGLKGGLDSIKGRGNYSWANWEKKPFAISLKNETSVLGLPSGTDYSLIANASDDTLVRNDIARQMEVRSGIPFAMTGVFADLYINGDYMGNYYLCADIDIGPEKIDISNIEEKNAAVLGRSRPEAADVYETPEMKGWNHPESVSDVTGGYLIQREFPDRYMLEYGTMKSGFITPGKEHFIVESPKYCSVDEINYIHDFVSEAEKAIMDKDGINTDTGKRYDEYLDIRSFADRYLVEETTKNYDGGVSSAYYFKDSDLIDGQLHSGPGWDFDMSLGNYLEWMELYEEDAGGLTRLSFHADSGIWFAALLDKKEFTDIVKEDYLNFVRPYICELKETGIDEYEKLLSASAAMDAVRWKEMYDKTGCKEDPHRAYEYL
ncbi:MAG: YfhO family protein, partial [Lachnospiraceae bacterium]|nr:YfhO family protein [Lachnospiraceae bacterium]